MHISLVRNFYGPDVTLGTLIIGEHQFATLEEPWKADPDGPGGQAGIAQPSCVPDGVYSLLPHNGAKFKDVWVLANHLLGVYREPADIPPGQKWGRAAVLIHSGNSTADIEGCILVGMRHGTEGGVPWVYESRKALDAVRTLLVPGNSHDLTIVPADNMAGTV